MQAWDTLTAAIDDLDAVLVQVRQARARQTTCRIHDLLSRQQVGSEHAGQVGTVIEVDEGPCIVRWLHPGNEGEVRPVELYASITALWLALCSAGTLLLSLAETSERIGEHGARDTRVSLTPRQREVVGLIGRGLTNGEIARQLGLRPSTVKNLCTRIFRTLDVQDRTQAALMARDLDLAH